MAGADGADVKIELRAAPAALDPPTTFAEDCQVGGEEILLNVRGVARYWMRSGRSLVVDRHPNSHMNDVLVYLLGSGLGAILHQRGHFPLHASAFVRGEECIGFMGESGAGKSTLAAMLSKRGFKLLSDDVLVTIPAQGRGLLAMPSSVALKLTTQSLPLAGFDTAVKSFDSSDRSKMRIGVESRFSDRPARLTALYRLQWLVPPTADPEIDRLAPFGALTVLRRNVYQSPLIDAMRREARFLAFASKVVSEVDLFEYRRGMSLDLVESQVDFLLHHVRARKPTG
jgi:hypothetical protein